MSFDPTATSIMQPYGLPCALSTEKQVMAKTARKAAPIAIEATSEEGRGTEFLIRFPVAAQRAAA